MRRGTCPTSRISGVESWKAVCSPTLAWVAPGPRVTGLAGELAVGLRHVRRGRLVARRDQPDRGVAQGVEDRDVALSGDAEGGVDAVQHELVDENAGDGAGHSEIG
jgi:hypothetical protein